MTVDLADRDAVIIFVSLIGISAMFAMFAWQYRRAIRRSPLSGITARQVGNMRIAMRICIGAAVAACLGAIWLALYLWL